MRRGFVIGVIGGWIGFTGCSAVSPPPLIPMHAGTAPSPRGETTVTLVLGMAGELFGGDGWGVAVRGEHQVGDATAVGVQLAGARGEEGEGKDPDSRRHWLVELRGYTRVASPSNDWAAGMASAGFTAMDTGMRSLTFALGGAVSYPNATFVPALGVFGAVSIPVRRGRGFGTDHDKYPHTTWWFGGSVDFSAPLGDENQNTPSLESGIAFGDGGDDSTQFSVSVADSHRF